MSAERVFAGRDEFIIDSGRDDIVGSPAPPSLKQTHPSVLRQVRWPVAIGVRTFIVACKYSPDVGGSGNRPRIMIPPTPELGVLTAVVATAVAGADVWRDLTLSLTVNNAGVLEVWFMHRNFTNRDQIINWDNIRKT
jgi:hypothetical protein